MVRKLMPKRLVINIKIHSERMHLATRYPIHYLKLSEISISAMISFENLGRD